MNLRILSLALVVMSITACNVENTSKSRGPIILGDSSTIVTETDPEALRDLMPDLQIAEEHVEAADTVAITPTDTGVVTSAAKPVASAPANPPGNGLNVAFKEVTIFIPNISTRSFSKADLQKARSATYELTDGNLAGAEMQLSGGTVSKVSQRYETVIVLKDGSEQLPLESLGKYTSGWQPLSSAGRSYPISGLEPSRLGFRQASASAIRNAVQQAARRKRLSRSKTQEWMNAAKNVRAANQAPANVVLRSAMWRIEGKDAAGKNFSKELRIDVPL